jgi:multidrug efflux pump
MNFTDIFIRRPVLASVVSLFIVVLGLRALFSLPVNQYPKTQNAVVTIALPTLVLMLKLSQVSLLSR